MVITNRFAAVLVSMLFGAIGSSGSAQTLTVLYNFGSNPGDPTYPTNVGAIAEAKDGSMWTTSQQGGQYGKGTICKFTPDGKMTVMYSFDTTHGAGPQSGLTLGADGNFYGTAYGGGRYGVGTIFKISPTGTFTMLHEFVPQDGSYPIAAPVQGKDGNMYGVTDYTNNNQLGCVYRISPNGSFTPLFHFGAKVADVAVYGIFAVGFCAGSDGNFYGTTIKGGTNFGTIYKVTPSGQVTALHQFDGANGATSCGIMQGSDGNLYGTCYNGGGAFNAGLVYKMAPNGQYTVLHTFVLTDGGFPWGSLVEAKDGFLYGTTRGGGTGNRGVIFRLKKDGSDYAVVYNRNVNMTEGLYCQQPGIQHTNGNLYNCVWQGGTKGAGIFYCLDMKTFSLSPLSGKVGSAVTFSGFGFTGATEVTFNGVKATFKVNSDQSITATVPQGAAAGTVKVVTPNGTLTSKTLFQVVT